LPSIGIISLGGVAAFLAIAKSRMQKSGKHKGNKRIGKIEKEKSAEKNRFIKKVKVLLLSLHIYLK
jgi:hypothetical protein